MTVLINLVSLQDDLHLVYLLRRSFIPEIQKHKAELDDSYTDE